MTDSLDARAKKIIDGAIELREAERRAFLDRACAGDPQLRARVETLLGAAEKDDQFLRSPTVGHTAPGGATTLTEQAGAVIGHYKLLELIGEGGFGSVFMAEQTEPVRRRVALKVIKLGMDTRAVVARFEQERQALALMDHPNIAKVLDAGATAAGRPYFVMELVRGEPITAFCDAANLTIPERLELFTQVCRAVQHAHTKGVIHRDIKPGNVLVSMSDGRPFCKVIDFGIAKATERPLTDKTVFTEFRQLIGTPEYMSPEQAAGGLDIDTRTDVYSLGVLMYELLAGVTPLDPQRLRSAAFDEMQRIIREVDPPAPSTRLSQRSVNSAGIAAMRRTEPRRLGAIVRGELDWIVMRALEKDRARRYDSAGNFAADVERYLAGEPVQAAPVSLAYRLRTFVRRNRLAVAAATAIVVALLIGLAGALWQARVASQQRDAATKSAQAALDAKKDAEARRAETEQIAAFQEAQLRDIDPERMGKEIRAAFISDARAALERANLPAYEIEDRQHRLSAMLDETNPTNIALRTLDESIFARALKAADEQFKDQPLIRARLLQSLSNTMRELGMIDQAEAPQAEALAVRRRVLGNENADTVISLGCSGLLLLAKGKVTEAEKVFKEAETIGSRVLGPDHRETLNSTANLALALQMQGKSAEANQTYRDLLERCRRALGPDDRDTLQVMNNLAGSLMDAGDAPAAEPLFREVLAKRRHALGDDHPDTIQSLSNLALALEKTGRTSDAEPLYREALDRSRRVRGEDHPDTLLYMGNLGYLLTTLGRLDEAEPLTREALERRRKVLGDNSWETMFSMNNMGRLLEAQGKLPEAEKFLREGFDRRRATLGDDHPDTLASSEALGTILLRQGRPAEAEPLLLKVLGTKQGTPGDAHTHDRIATKLADLYDALNRAEPGKGYDMKSAEWRGHVSGK